MRYVVCQAQMSLERQNYPAKLIIAPCPWQPVSSDFLLSYPLRPPSSFLLFSLFYFFSFLHLCLSACLPAFLPSLPAFFLTLATIIPRNICELGPPAIRYFFSFTYSSRPFFFHFTKCKYHFFFFLNVSFNHCVYVTCTLASDKETRVASSSRTKASG